MKLLVTLLVYLNSIGPVFGAVDELSFEYSSNNNYLPYKVEVIERYDVPAGRITLPIPAQAVAYTRDGSTEYIGVFATNPQFRDNSAAQLTFHSAVNWNPIQTVSIDLMLSDFSCFIDSQTQAVTVTASGYRRDSAFVCRVVAGSNQPEYCLVRTGCDRSQAGWKGLREFVYAGDIDGDGHIEALYHLGAARSVTNRELCCVDMSTLTVKWRIPFPMLVTSAHMKSCPGDSSPSLQMIGYGAKPGVEHPSFNDMLCHLVRVDASGHVLADRVIGASGEMLPIVSQAHDGHSYCSYSVPFLPPTDSLAAVPAGRYLSALDCRDSLRMTSVVRDYIFDIWLGDYRTNDARAIYTMSEPATIRVYDTLLQVVAESKSIPSLETFCGYTTPLSGADSVLAFSFADGMGLFSKDLRKLAFIPAKGRTLYTLDPVQGAAYIMVIASPEGYAVARVEHRGFTELLAVFYLDFRPYILGFISFLLLSLLLAGYCSRRLSQQKAQLERAHAELAATHQALQQAQAQIVTQEKYRLAQNIAGSFAHEIRNALFPANVSLMKLNEVVDLSAAGTQRIDKLLNMTARAVTRAISLTDLITQYAKLESHYLPEPTQFSSVVTEILAVNSSRIDQQNVRVQVSGPDDPLVAIHAQHLYMLINNLVINALDAMDSVKEPLIVIEWSAQSGLLDVCVADTGCGIAHNDRERIFEAFYSTKPDRGTGLGLATVKRLADMYGGGVSLVDKPGYSTAFALSLRLWSAEESS